MANASRSGCSTMIVHPGCADGAAAVRSIRVTRPRIGYRGVACRPRDAWSPRVPVRRLGSARLAIFAIRPPCARDDCRLIEQDRHAALADAECGRPCARAARGKSRRRSTRQDPTRLTTGTVITVVGKRVFVERRRRYVDAGWQRPRNWDSERVWPSRLEARPFRRSSNR